MKDDKPFVSVIIPCRNEEKYIEECLSSLLKQDYPKEKLEILVIDGMSKDKTREIIKKKFGKYPLIRLLENPQRFTPFGLNIGIKEAKGKVIVRMDAHAKYANDYISRCVDCLKEHKVDNVGGAMKTLPGSNTLIAKTIALCLSHPFGAGNSYFRIGSKKPQLVDTVFGGCYRKEVFEKIGLYNEKMIRSQDMEFNLRLKEAGCKILLVPDITSYYYSQPTLIGFLMHNISDGIWITYPLKFGIQAFSWRHLTPLAFLVSLVSFFLLSSISGFFSFFFSLVVVLYILANLFFSLKISKRERNFGYLFLLPIVFLVRHLGYALGSFFGLIKLLKR
jgi:glycosyltransferase involved in cell wall biosynthesis